MKTEDAEKFLSLLKRLSIVFDDNKPITKERVDIMADILSGYDISKIERGIEFVLKTRSYKGFPLPAEIIEGMSDKNDGYW